ncbi:MAG: dienelactone hydrolase family protein [Acidobacteria bacterium]|nr:dienelactone hydrolase family protein [Acidobacteriota bacterium]
MVAPQHAAIRAVIGFFLAFVGGCGSGVGQALSPTVVSFPTEDGKTIVGTLHLPQAPRLPVAGVILITEPGWILRGTFESHARNLAKNHGMAALTMDFRGNANSLNGKLYDTFSPEEIDKLQLDVRGAAEFLTSQKMVDPKRIGIVSAGVGANYALLEAARNPAVQAHVIISGILGDRARNYIKTRGDVPILCLVGKDDRDTLPEMAGALALSKNKDSNMILLESGHGTNMFVRFEGLAEQVGQWLASNVKGLGNETPISFNTEDGWSLHGRLRIPESASKTANVPGVVLVHGAQHDEDTYFRMVKALAKRGIATLTYDWRGKNRPLDDPKGHYGVNLKPEDQQNNYLDTKAAINLLASQEGVDSNRIGLIGATAGTEQTFRASLGDARIKTIVALTLEHRSDAIKEFLTTRNVPVFFIASQEDRTYQLGSFGDLAREAYLMSKNRYSQFLLFDDAGHGSEMLKKKEDLEAMIVRWLVDKLAK